MTPLEELYWEGQRDREQGWPPLPGGLSGLSLIAYRLGYSNPRTEEDVAALKLEQAVKEAEA